MGFRNNFLWGGAIAACQTEGAWNEEGKTLTFPDIIKKIKPEQRRNFGQAQIDEQALEMGKTGPVSDYPKRWGRSSAQCQGARLVRRGDRRMSSSSYRTAGHDRSF